jgi:AI-2 transport protein TqsA
MSLPVNQAVTSAVIAFAGIIALLIVGKPLLLPFAVAIIIWYVIDAMAASIRQLRIAKLQPFRHFGLLMAMLVIGLLISGVFSMIGDTVEQVRIAAPAYQDNAQKILDKFSSITGIEAAPVVKHWVSQLNMGKLIGNIAAGVMALAGDAGMVAIYVAFLLLEQRYFYVKIRLLFPNKDKRQKVQSVMHQMQVQIRQYLYLKTVVSALTGVLSYLVLIWVGVDYAPFWALLVFLLNYIPTIGSLVAVALPTLLALVQFETLTPFLILLISLGSLQMLIGNVIEPRLLGSSLNLSPLVVILALSLWGQIWGIIGMFLSVPVTVIAMIICSNFPQTRPVAIMLSENGRLRNTTGTLNP